MASSAKRSSGRGPGSLFRLVVMAASLSAMLPAATQAQDVDRRRFVAAQRAYNSAQSERDLDNALYEDALAEVIAGRESGDQARHVRALAIFQDASSELELSDRLLAEAYDELEQARRAYRATVYARQDELFDELPRATDERDRTLILREIAYLEGEANRLTRSDEILLIPDDPFPEISIAPGDTPDDIRAKAELLDRRADRYQDVLADIEAQSELFQRRLRHARMAQDFGADLSRFDDLRVPVGTSDAASGNTQGPTGTEELSQRIEELNQTREYVIERRNIARARAEEFRQRIGGARV